jgi:hypothetical protein
MVWAIAMYALMFVHLLADFPHGAPWSDMSKATDEGWYGGGALHHFVFGHWYLPDSFNPAVAMPDVAADAGRMAASGGWWRAAATGLALVAMVWTKTTAVVLAVSIVYFLYARAKEQNRPWVMPVVTAVSTAVIVWGLYFLAWVRPRYLRDFKYVFAINNYR